MLNSHVDRLLVQSPPRTRVKEQTRLLSPGPRQTRLSMSTITRNEKSSMVTFQTSDGPAHGYLALPEAKAHGVMVLHAWWGLNDFFKGICDRLANEGYVAFAPDLNKGTVLSTVEDATEFQKKRDEAREVQPVITGAFDYFQRHPSLASPRIGVIGFSMGAWWAMNLANQKPDAIRAVVTFYGAGEVDPAKVQAAFLGHFAKDDEWEPLDNILRLEASLKQAGKNVTFHVYPKAKHWFIEENRPKDYEAESAKLAWKRTLDFLRTQLSQA